MSPAMFFVRLVLQVCRFLRRPILVKQRATAKFCFLLAYKENVFGKRKYLSGVPALKKEEYRLKINKTPCVLQLANPMKMLQKFKN